jgi:hypothetical protein
MFRALLAHPQEKLLIRHLVYCVRVMSAAPGLKFHLKWNFNPGACRGPYFLINWIKIASRWSHYTDITWCTENKTLTLTLHLIVRHKPPKRQKYFNFPITILIKANYVCIFMKVTVLYYSDLLEYDDFSLVKQLLTFRWQNVLSKYREPIIYWRRETQSVFTDAEEPNSYLLTQRNQILIYWSRGAQSVFTDAEEPNPYLVTQRNPIRIYWRRETQFLFTDAEEPNPYLLTQRNPIRIYTAVKKISLA